LSVSCNLRPRQAQALVGLDRLRQDNTDTGPCRSFWVRLIPAQDYYRSMPGRIDHLRACAGTRSFENVGINRWRTETDGQRSDIILCRPADFGADMSRYPNGLCQHEHVRVGLCLCRQVSKPTSA
jgi:hypothetical protein